MKRNDFLEAQNSLYEINDRLVRNDLEIDYDFVDNSIRSEYFIYREKLLIERLNKLGIENLETIIGSSYPISRLRNAGIRNIGELENMSENELERIPGIGPKSADKICLAYKQVKDSMEKILKVKITKSEDSIDLLKFIYLKLYLKDNQDAIDTYIKNRNTKLKEISSLLQKSRSLSFSILKWFFVRKKPETYSLYKSLKQVDISALEKQYQDYKIKIYSDELFLDFEQRSAEYYAVLDDLKIVEVKEHEFIDDLLVKSIESLQLNTNNLKVTLRGYQTFAAKYIIHQRRTLIGDEMGLGKTIEAIAAMNHIYQESDSKTYFLVVCPLSVLVNWRREIEKWSMLLTHTYHGNRREYDYIKWQNEGGVLLTTFDTAKNLNVDKIRPIDLMVVDEAHYIKNPETQRTKASLNLSNHADYVVLMSGTPLENRVSEMIFLISMLQKDVANELDSYAYLSNTDTFRKKAAPVYLRRNREDVLTELPEIEMHELWVPFSKKEYETYLEALSQGNFMSMRRAAWTGKTRKNSPKLDALLDLCDQAKIEGRKILIFSFFKDVLNTVYEALADRAFGPITGSVSNLKRQELIDKFTEAKPGSVLISQIMAGGVGLNIQAASVIIICEPQYKPSTENQAISRAYRMGQTENVLVYRILTEESIDESMMNLLYSKDQIFDAYARDSYVAETSKEATNLSSKETQEKILNIEKQRHAIKLLEKEKQ